MHALKDLSLAETAGAVFTLHAVAGDLEGLHHPVRPVVADRPGGHFVAVADHVVGVGQRLARLLVERVEDAFPVRPELSLPLTHPALAGPIDTAGRQLGYVIT